MSDVPVLVVGAGPAGLAAAYELVKHGVRPLVLEAGAQVGGLARTVTYKGYRFDLGGHRFYTKVAEVQELWQKALGRDLLKRPRLSRIYYNGRFYRYPLALGNVVRNLGLVESGRILGSYMSARFRPHAEEESFEHWVVNRFGDRLYRTFFKGYTEKVWGIPCSAIRADWAAQRIQGLSLVRAVAHALFGRQGARSLIEEFHYPRLGPGQMWERFQEIVELKGGRVMLRSPVQALHHRDNRITSVAWQEAGRPRLTAVDHVITSMALGELVQRLDPPPPPEVLAAARGLRYRDFLIVALVIDRADLFPDNWIYVHTPAVRVGRIQNFKNWSPDMVPDPSKTCLGMEYFCSRGDDLWGRTDAELQALAARENHRLGLADAAEVQDGCVIRQPRAYPVYDGEYRRHVEEIRAYLARFDNLQTIGRNGLHRYNNQDHSMVCGLQAARNLFGATHNVWEVNTERSYYEEQQIDPQRPVRKPDERPTVDSARACWRGIKAPVRHPEDRPC
jgi:protoporphyrinogen oxidase